MLTESDKIRASQAAWRRQPARRLLKVGFALATTRKKYVERRRTNYVDGVYIREYTDSKGGEHNFIAIAYLRGGKWHLAYNYEVIGMFSNLENMAKKCEALYEKFQADIETQISEKE
jgi:hypothetical protein